MPRLVAALLAPLVALLLTACGSGGQAHAGAPPALVIGGIPDQDVALLQEVPPWWPPELARAQVTMSQRLGAQHLDIATPSAIVIARHHPHPTAPG